MIDEEEYFATLILLYGRAPDRGFADRFPAQAYGVCIRSRDTQEGRDARNYATRIRNEVKKTRPDETAPAKFLNRFIRWQMKSGLIDTTVKRTRRYKQSYLYDEYEEYETPL